MSSVVSLIRSAELSDRAQYAYASTVPADARLIFLAGSCPLDEQGGTTAIGDYAGQAGRCIQNLIVALRDAGATLSDVASTRVLVASTNRADLVAAWEVVRDAFGTHDVPSTLMGVTVLSYRSFSVRCCVPCEFGIMSENREFDAVSDAQAAEDACEMCLYRCWRAVQKSADLGVGEACGYARNDLALTIGQAGESSGRSLLAAACFVFRVHVEEYPGVARRENSESFCRLSDGVDDVPRRGFFEEVTGSAGVERRDDVFVGVECGQGEDLSR
jgi:enamine deaminase RidA (YjgF/YER057c/UK114 family)